jgi:hypothetical protein
VIGIMEHFYIGVTISLTVKREGNGKWIGEATLSAPTRGTWLKSRGISLTGYASKVEAETGFRRCPRD